MTFFLEINFAAMLSYAYPIDIVVITLKFLLKWAARICYPLKWVTAQKRLRNIDLLLRTFAGTTQLLKFQTPNVLFQSQETLLLRHGSYEFIF